MARKIIKKIPAKTIKQDLERYRKMAIKIGATEAKVITSQMVFIDERVRAKCRYPVCKGYGTSINCPPFTPNIDEVRALIKRYAYGIFFKIEYPSELAVESKDKGKDSTRKLSQNRFANTRNEIIAKIEAESFYDGYYFALGYGGGTCKYTYCADTKCSALTPGEHCKSPLKARPSMEAMGMDVFGMAASAGWEIYPIGKSTKSSEAPCANTLGLILIQ